METTTYILRRVDVAKNMDRFYELSLEPTLFGHWAVVRRWGRFRATGQTREVWFEAPAHARALIDQLRSQKLRRGYVQAGVSSC